ncbi:MAG: chromate transporter [Rikenellaceae bacterium]
MIFFNLFYIFCKIGLFGFGGGYAMLSMIQGDVVTKYNWVTPMEFTDIVAISQMTPGPIGINMATYTGYVAVLNSGFSQPMAILGSFIATFAVMLPSFFLMILVSYFLLKFSEHYIVKAIFSGLRPAIIGLLAAAALLLMKSENFGSLYVDKLQFFVSIGIFIFAFFATNRLKLSPILMILISGVLGYIIYN